MPTIASPVFLAALWLLVVFAVVALWLAAMSDIVNRSRERLFNNTQLIVMAAAVSVAAVLSVGAAGAVLVQARPGASLAALNEDLVGAGYARCQDPASSFVFSFGLERASYPPPSGAVEDPQARMRGACRTHG
jgi:hypothetical protein